MIDVALLTFGRLIADPATAPATPVASQPQQGVRLLATHPRQSASSGASAARRLARGRATHPFAIFSPDGDGRNDVLRLRVRAPRGSAVSMTVYAWGGASFGKRRRWSVVDRSSAVPARRGSVTVSWDGSSRRGPVRDRTYVATVCASGATARGAVRLRAGTLVRRKRGRAPWLRPGCLPTPVVVQVRRLSVGVRSTGSFSPGATVPLSFGTDKTVVTYTLRQDGPKRARPVARGRIRTTGATSVRLPSTLEPDRYHLVVRDRMGYRRTVPIVVRNDAFDVASPPAHTALVVWPYLTWRAYSAMDADRNGKPDTWYEDFRQRSVTLVGDLHTIGAENGFRQTLPFSRWLHQQGLGRRVQMITDVELESLSDDELRRYSAIVFPGHTEYYTQTMHDRVQAYRDAGGDLVLLGANNFYRQVELAPGINRVTMVNVRGNCPRCYTVKDGERVDQCLLGLGYDGCCFQRGAMFRATKEGLQAAPWLWEGTGIRAGDRFGWADIEVDRVNTRLSPGTTVPLATARIKKDGRMIVAQMGLTTMANGGETFATGNEHFLSQRQLAPGRRRMTHVMLGNLWNRMVDDRR